MATVGLIAAALLAQGRSEDAFELSKRETSAYVRAFNEHKPKVLDALFTRDADLAFIQGSDVKRLEYGLVRGADEIAGCLTTFFDLYPKARLSQAVMTARLIRPDVLITDVDFEIVGLPDEAGPIRGRSLVIRVNESGAWKIAADRNVSRTHAAR
jgi:uncharacterized protein (TIGR02246 family)